MSKKPFTKKDLQAMAKRLIVLNHVLAALKPLYQEKDVLVEMIVEGCELKEPAKYFIQDVKNYTFEPFEELGDLYQSLIDPVTIEHATVGIIDNFSSKNTAWRPAKVMRFEDHIMKGDKK